MHPVEVNAYRFGFLGNVTRQRNRRGQERRQKIAYQPVSMICVRGTLEFKINWVEMVSTGGVSTLDLVRIKFIISALIALNSEEIL